MNRILSRVAFAAMAGALMLPASAMLPDAAPFAVTQAKAGILAQHEQTLSQYGSFYEHAKYGKVWVPAATTVPQGWHPYPACNWIYTKYGWYFDDKTAWGQIVHHYGRWAHEDKVGWMWVPGEEFSPGWVIWRTSEQWTGWAPTPPDVDMKTLDTESFNTDKHWTFIETKKFGSKCQSGDVVAASPQLFMQTVYVRDFTIVDGIVVFVFPHWLVGPIVNINIAFGPWAPIVIVNVIQNWVFVWNNVVINIACNVAPPPAPNQIINPINNTPPAPPPGKRTDLRPLKPLDPPTYRPIVDPVKPNYPIRPIGEVKPVDPIRPIVDPVRPIKPIDPGIGNGTPGGRPGIKPIDPIVDTRPGGKPIRPIDPGFGRPSGGTTIGNVKPIDTRPIVSIKPIDTGRPTITVPGKPLNTNVGRVPTRPGLTVQTPQKLSGDPEPARTIKRTF